MDSWMGKKVAWMADSEACGLWIILNLEVSEKWVTQDVSWDLSCVISLLMT